MPLLYRKDPGQEGDQLRKRQQDYHWSDGNEFPGRSLRPCSISSVRFLFALPRLRARHVGGIKSDAVITTDLAIAEKCHAVRNIHCTLDARMIPQSHRPSPYADDTAYWLLPRRDLIFCQHVVVIDISFRIRTVADVGLGIG